jgi:Protein of unknown function (DUF2490)
MGTLESDCHINKLYIYFMNLVKASFFSIFIAATVSISAQQHNNFWAKGTIVYAIAKNADVAIEMHHRTQNDFGHSNLLAKPLMNAVRPLIIFKPINHFKLLCSPLAYFENYKIIQNAEDASKPSRKELRMFLAAELLQPIIHPLTLMSRTGMEYRMIEGLPHIWRMRNRIDAILHVSNNVTVTVGDEILVNLKGSDDAHFFDQNRVIINAQLTLNKRVKFELGYIYNSRLLSQSIDHIEENNVTSGIIYTFSKFVP